jgi:translation initiation factor IF-3
MLSMRVRIYVCTRFIFLYWRCCVISNREHQINEEIKDKEIRLIGVDGSQLGIVSADEALELAFQQDLDLVKIAPQAQPPVCRIMDYGKFCFEQSKREKEAKKNQKVIEVKEIRMSSTIDTHDFNTKVNQAIKFLNGGDKLKVSVRFRKRTVAHPQFGEEILAKFKDEISEAGVVDKPSKMEGRSLVMFVSPKQSK